MHHSLSQTVATILCVLGGASRSRGPHCLICLDGEVCLSFLLQSPWWPADVDGYVLFLQSSDSATQVFRRHGRSLGIGPLSVSSIAGQHTVLGTSDWDYTRQVVGYDAGG